LGQAAVAGQMQQPAAVLAVVPAEAVYY